jgi:hypothetical protein
MSLNHRAFLRLLSRSKAPVRSSLRTTSILAGQQQQQQQHATAMYRASMPVAERDFPDDDGDLSPARAKLKHILMEYRRKKCVLSVFVVFLNLLATFFSEIIYHVLLTRFPSLSQSFGQTLFSRFIKEMVLATDINHDGMISQSELQTLLVNIGAQDQVTDRELQDVMEELGQYTADSDEKLIHVDHVQDLILGGKK